LILDTTYLLPLLGIRIREDLFSAIVSGRVQLKLKDIRLSSISLFEIQAKAAKLRLPPGKVVKAINTLKKSFEVISFTRRGVIEVAHELRSFINDYVDCVIIATAIDLGDPLVTEDSLIHSAKRDLEDKYKLHIFSYRDLTS